MITGKRSGSPAVILDQIEQALARIDDDGAGLLGAGIGDGLAVEARVGWAPRPFRELGRLAARLLPRRRGLLVRCRPTGRGGAHAAPASEQELEEPAAEILPAWRIGADLGALPAAGDRGLDGKGLRIGQRRNRGNNGRA